MIANDVLTALEKHASPADAAFLERFFKTGEGEYGAGDVFIGVRVPQTRQVAVQFKAISLTDIEALLESPIHEMRLCAVIIMTLQAKRADASHLKALAELYLRRTDRINNWDIVDTSCRDIIGEYILQNPEKRRLARRLARSDNIWERRIAMISTWQWIRAGHLGPTFEIAELLIGDTHDLIHKAVGWMLREAGKKDSDQLRQFLISHIRQLPRTTLRYAIERFEPDERRYFLKLK